MKKLLAAAATLLLIGAGCGASLTGSGNVEGGAGADVTAPGVDAGVDAGAGAGY